MNDVARGNTCCRRVEWIFVADSTTIIVEVLMHVMVRDNPLLVFAARTQDHANTSSVGSPSSI